MLNLCEYKKPGRDTESWLAILRVYERKWPSWTSRFTAAYSRITSAHPTHRPWWSSTFSANVSGEGSADRQRHQVISIDPPRERQGWQEMLSKNLDPHLCGKMPRLLFTISGLASLGAANRDSWVWECQAYAERIRLCVRVNEADVCSRKAGLSIEWIRTKRRRGGNHQKEESRAVLKADLRLITNVSLCRFDVYFHDSDLEPTPAWLCCSVARLLGVSMDLTIAPPR